MPGAGSESEAPGICLGRLFLCTWGHNLLIGTYIYNVKIVGDPPDRGRRNLKEKEG